MSNETTIQGEANIEKYMALLESEQDLKVKLQQLFAKKVASEAEYKAEIQRLKVELSEKEATFFSKQKEFEQELENVKYTSNIHLSKLKKCRNAFDEKDKALEKVAKQVEELKKEAESKNIVPKANKEPKVEIKSLKAPIHDLKMIKGIGPKIQEMLKSKGITSFDQIASFKAKEVENLNDEFDLKDRIKREEWVKQAKLLLKKS